MKLVTFAVEKFRSLDQTKPLPVSDLTVLIGPNNEGKSNILRALVMGMRLLSQGSQVRRGRYRTDIDRDYVWKRDFPVSLQGNEPDGKTLLDFEFELDEQESEAFKKEIGSTLNGYLPVRLRVGQSSVEFQIRKQGSGGKRLTEKRDPIAKFIAARLQVEYVPAVRTAERAVEVVYDMLARELHAITDLPEFQAAWARIEELQKPILKAVSEKIRETLRDFLPDVSSVTVKKEDQYRTLARDCTVVVDDGTPTDLRLKGDGVQSLAALSLIRHVSAQASSGRKLILAVEEPEAHLHPGAIHKLRSVLSEIAERQQVVLTTHCPVFVNRLDIGSNVLVKGNRARPARSIGEVRESLGVRTSDNLRSAELILVVEGECDRLALLELLSAHSVRIGEAIKSGVLGVDSLGGGANLSYKLTQIRDTICNVHCFLDNDKAAKDAARKASDDGLLVAADQTFTICNGMPEAEIEDIYEVATYESTLKTRYNVALTATHFRANKPKWSDRVRSCFLASGQPWDDRVEKQVKEDVARCVAANPKSALNKHKRGSFDNLIEILDEKLASLSGEKRVGSEEERKTG